jgi:hypothetical protein
MGNFDPATHPREWPQIPAGDKAAIKADAHHLRGLLAFEMMHVEAVLPIKM